MLLDRGQSRDASPLERDLERPVHRQKSPGGAVGLRGVS